MIVVITDWNEGFNKVQFNILLRDCAGLGLGAAKRAVDEILDDKHVSVEVEESSAGEFLRRAGELGVVAALASDHGRASDRSSERSEGIRGDVRLHS